MDLKTDLGSRLVDSTAITESEYFSTKIPGFILKKKKITHSVLIYDQVRFNL